MTLEEKIRLSSWYLEQAVSMADPQRIAVAWTGGKDSTVALALWKELLQGHGFTSVPARAVNLDTGLKFPEVLAFRDEIADAWDIALSIVKPDVDVADYPVAADPVQCCNDLKVTPLRRAVSDMDIAVLITGVRADEHTDRAGRSWHESRDDPAHVQLNPLIHWTEMDIWSFTLERGLPYCPLYNHGYRSLGCRPCTAAAQGDERSGRSREKEDRLHLLRSLGYF
ncbi:phosphoadenosine phosphosulfate reductase family protein [Desulfovermiculus halophilus]|jgi:phosphoadenosine phosphosulfate reductase|uniref:phosphoadenosine phosphosulfate reductase family protein n=1 Tax=Desulfovermiculus halophilus TaxID=339722 RepID=UPI000487F84C|nr:phosphoadenosine phosphosulfate reductase family protein [Desulfovermiculus halophilus]